MKRYLFFALKLLICLGCRKDNSVLVNPNTNSGDCLIIKGVSPDGRRVSDIKYTDSILTEDVTNENGTVIAARYLTIETPKKFIYHSGSKNPQDAKTRIYLNDDGSVAKEVAISLNPDGKTYTEDLSQQRLFTYNSKKLLTRVDVSLDDNGVFDIIYDSKNRVERIILSDGQGMEFFIYDNITHDNQKKNDNYVSLVLFDSLSAFFIPSLNSTYVKTYRIYSPLIPLFTTESVSEYKFSDGKLSEIQNSLTVLGATQVNTVKITLNCK